MRTAVLEYRVTHRNKGLHSFSPKGHCPVPPRARKPVCLSPLLTQHLCCSVGLWGQDALLSRLEDRCLEMRVPRGDAHEVGLLTRP